MSKGEFPGSYGFKNSAPAYPHDAWASVSLFADTYGFLPGENTQLEKLDKQNLMALCQLALDSACKIDLAGNGIKVIQDFLHASGISPEKLSVSEGK